MLDTAEMIVACSQCRTRYRIDASRYGGRATNFKCSKCGHVFPLRVPEPSRETPAPWMVTVDATGEEIAAPSLDAVKRLIIEGRVGANDVLSRSGRKGKALGEIEQFATFLRVQERSGAFRVAEVQEVDKEGVEAELGEAEAGEVFEAQPLGSNELEAVSHTAETPIELEAVDEEASHRGVDSSGGYAAAVYEERALTGEQTAMRTAIESRKRTVLVVTLIGLVVLVVILAALYLMAPDTFFSLFPFLGGEPAAPTP